MIVRYEPDTELLAEVASPLADYDRVVIIRIRSAIAEGRQIVLSEVGVLALWAMGCGYPDECMAVANYSPGNPHPMWSQVRRWASAAGALVPGLADYTIAECRASDHLNRGER